MPSTSRSPTRARPPAAGPEPVARFRLRITAGEAIAVGPGRIDLLEAIDRTGSITAAAQSLDMSYRRAWTLLDSLNQALREPAVDSAQGGLRGGGSRLTDTGRQLVGLYRKVEQTAAQACRADLARLAALIAR